MEVGNVGIFLVADNIQKEMQNVPFRDVTIITVYYIHQ